MDLRFSKSLDWRSGSLLLSGAADVTCFGIWLRPVRRSLVSIGGGAERLETEGALDSSAG